MGREKKGKVSIFLARCVHHTYNSSSQDLKLSDLQSKILSQKEKENILYINIYIIY